MHEREMEMGEIFGVLPKVFFGDFMVPMKEGLRVLGMNTCLDDEGSLRAISCHGIHPLQGGRGVG